MRYHPREFASLCSFTTQNSIILILLIPVASYFGVSSILLQFRFRFIKQLIQLTKELYLVVPWKSFETNQWLAYDLWKKYLVKAIVCWHYLPLQLPFSMARSFAVFSLWFLRLRSELLSSNALATLTWSEKCIIWVQNVNICLTAVQSIWYHHYWLPNVTP